MDSYYYCVTSDDIDDVDDLSYSEDEDSEAVTTPEETSSDIEEDSEAV